MTIKKRKVSLSKPRQAWADSRAHGVLVGTGVRPNEGDVDRYRKQMDSLIRSMRVDYVRNLRAAFNGSRELVSDESIAITLKMVLGKLSAKWDKIVNERANKMAQEMIDKTSKHNQTAVNSSLTVLASGGAATQAQKIAIKTPAMPAAMKPMIQASVTENVSLIKSISERFHTDIEGAVMRSIQPGGRGMADVYDAAMKTQEVCSKRAKLIARDQVHKINATYDVERMKSAGVKKFKWRHSGGGKEPRVLHMEYDGEVFEYDNPPIIDKRTGERGFPGQAINCRCYMVPVVEW